MDAGKFAGSTALCVIDHDIIPDTKFCAFAEKCERCSVNVVQSTLFSQAIHEQANNTFCE